MAGYEGFQIVHAAIGGEPVPAKKAWADFRRLWEENKKGTGTCCFCLRAAEVCDVAPLLEKAGLQNFTDFPKRLHKGLDLCLGCFAVLKEYALVNPACLFILTPSSRLKRSAEGNRFELDNTSIFEMDKEAGRRAFLARLLDPPDEPFVCGRKPKSSHTVPFSPVNPPRAEVVRVVYPVGGTTVVVYFDRERHRALVDDASEYWRGGGECDRLRAYRGTPLLDMVMWLTKPGDAEDNGGEEKKKRRKPKKSRRD